MQHPLAVGAKKTYVLFGVPRTKAKKGRQRELYH